MDSKTILNDSSKCKNAVQEKTCSADNRLRLRRNNSESLINRYNVSQESLESNRKNLMDSNTAGNQSEEILDGNSVDNQDASILDFKSPEPKRTNRTKVIKPPKTTILPKRKKTATKKLNFYINDRKEANSKNREQNRRESQPSIESTFFKPKSDGDQDNSTSSIKTALVCPICFKSCKDVDSQSVHMKICAIKNKISTKKLLDALELQKRQEEERKLLGLLAAPVVPERKKPVQKKVNSFEESDIQLALALSKSLQEAEEYNAINDVEKVARLSDVYMCETTNQNNKGQLEKFGFANSKGVLLTKNKKRKPYKLTVLQTRSQEERNRILTERITEILIGNDTITQNLQEDVNDGLNTKQETLLRRPYLQNILCTEERLWDKAKLTPRQKYFYVSDLSQHIDPKPLKEKDMEDENSGEAMKEILCEMEVKAKEEQSNEVSNERCSLIKNNDNSGEKQYINSLADNWGNALNDSSASDLIVFVKDQKYVWAHKLVFYVRCSNMLIDIVPNDNTKFSKIKEKLCWTDVSQDIALAFLEFIYCGIINKYQNVFDDTKAFSNLRNLARKYKIEELFAYLRDKEDLKSPKIIEQPLIRRNSRKESTSNESKRSNEKEERVESFSVLSPEEESGNASSGSTIYEECFNPRNSNCQDLKTDIEEEEFPPKERDYLSNKNTPDCVITSPDLFNDTFDMEKEYLDADKSIVNLADRSPLAGPSKENKHLGTSNLINHSRESQRSTSCQKEPTEKVDLSPGRAGPVLSSSFRSTYSPEMQEESFKNLLQSPLNLSAVDALTNTPRTTRSEETKKRQSSLKKIKSNLSLFIELVQKENAKSESDFDSDDSLPSIVPKPYRNPFKIRQNDCSDSFISPRSTNLEPKKEEKIVKGLERFDLNVASPRLNEIARKEEKCVENRTYERPKHKSVTSLMQSSTRLINAKRYAEDYCKDSTIESINTSGDDCSEDSATVIKSPSALHESTIASEVDNDEIDLSMYAKYKKKKCRSNSIEKYRKFVKNYIASANKSQQQEVTVLSDIDLDDVPDFAVTSPKNCTDQRKSQELTNVDENLEINEAPHLTNFQENTDHIYPEFDDLDLRSPFINSHEKEMSDSEVEILSPAGIFKESNASRHAKSDSNIQMEGNSREVSVKVNLTPSKRNKLDTENSPVVIFSSPELSKDDFNPRTPDKPQTDDIAKTFDDDYDHIFETEIYLENVRIEDNKLKSPNQSKSIAIESPKVVIHNKSKDLNAEEFFLRKETSVSSKRSVGKLTRKSVSEGNFSTNARNNSFKSFNVTEERKCRCDREKRKNLKIAKSPIIIRETITPPPDYNSMNSPELHKELYKNGLKIQKRNRAVQLLTYFYNELHPVVSEIPEKFKSQVTVSSSDDEEPPTKRFNRNRSDGQKDIDECSDELALSQESKASTLSPINIIAEEIQFDDPSSEADSNGENIHQKFSSLLKVNKELHNKILSYEPLCIESVHSMLKADGFKCKMSLLMDFLDEQCITFYCQENSVKNKKKGKLAK